MKFTRILRKLVFVLLIALLAASLPAKPALAVEIINLDTYQGRIGQTITISGTGFFASATESRGINVCFAREHPGATINYSTDIYEIVKVVMLDSLGRFNTTFTVPAALTGGNTDENVSSGDYFVFVTYYYPELTTNQNGIGILDITSFYIVASSIMLSPIEGIVGTDVTINGAGFSTQEGIQIRFDGNPVAITSGDALADNTGSFTNVISIPTSKGGLHTITAIGSVSSTSAEATFTVKPEITISPEEGTINTPVTVTGKGFQANSAITIIFTIETSDISIATATSDANGSFSAIFNVPVPTVGTYEIKASDGTYTDKANFSVGISGEISPETSATSPGNVGTQVTISGVGFTAGGTVTVAYDGTQVATATVNTDRSFSATFNAPASSGGEHTIIATDGTNSIQRAFIMESTPPATPLPLKPEMDIQAEAETYFDWEDVTDPSGVTYTLQIATASTFSQDSIVMEKAGLTQSEYTIPREERLQSVSKEAPYYWHVKAVDGASNESQWTGAGKYYVGFSGSMPQYVIYIIIGVCALLFSIFTFWLGRKTAYY
jgi:hypothetical protein